MRLNNTAGPNTDRAPEQLGLGSKLGSQVLINQNARTRIENLRLSVPYALPEANLNEFKRTQAPIIE